MIVDVGIVWLDCSTIIKNKKVVDGIYFCMPLPYLPIKEIVEVDINEN